jgi:hypothetical protein
MQVYEYDRNLLQQDAVQFIAAYKYEVTTISTALNMHLYVRQRAPLLRKAPRVAGSSSSGPVGALFPPKPGTAQRRPGFSVQNVLKDLGGTSQQPAQPQQQQRTTRTPPRSPSGERWHLHSYIKAIPSVGQAVVKHDMHMPARTTILLSVP